MGSIRGSWMRPHVIFSTLPLWSFETLSVNLKETNQQVGGQSLFIPFVVHAALLSAPIVANLGLILWGQKFSALFITKEQSCPKGYCPIGTMKLYWGRNREQSWNTFRKVNHSVQKSITLALRPRSHRMQNTLRKGKQWNTLLQMGVFTQVARNIKGFACKFARKSAYASCVNWA